ncbi:MAG: hypothetical protein FWF88_00650 [Peptococcaceae bacterium]|nr:hypothetical protein [Peptococcaceae bacterium]
MIGQAEQTYQGAMAQIQDVRAEAEMSLKNLEEQEKNTVYLHQKIYALLQDLNADALSDGEEDICARRNLCELEVEFTETFQWANAAMADEREKLTNVLSELEQQEETLTHEYKKELSREGDPS